jgi:2-aminoadipate transaminase
LNTVALENDGPDLAAFEWLIHRTKVKFFYGIPNSQNPSGTTWSLDKRRAIADILKDSDTVLYDDDAFGELFFDNRPRPPVKRCIPD